jgi:hypothetical protein
LVGRALLTDRAASGQRGRELSEGAAVLLVLLGVAILASGILARPLVTTYPNFRVDWSYILPRLADLENQRFPISGMLPAVLAGVAVVGLGLRLGVAVIAVRQRAAAAIALLVGPLLLVAVLRVLDARMIAFQLIGTIYPLGLCGMAVLFDAVRQPASPGKSAITSLGRPAWLVLGAAVIALGLHGPRFAGAVSRYGGRTTPAEVRFSKDQLDQLAAAIGTATVDVDIDVRVDHAMQLAIAVLVEFGRRDLALQWQPGAWQLILSYRGWPPPSSAPPGVFRLIAAQQSPRPTETVVVRTEQYLLLRDRGVSP